MGIIAHSVIHVEKIIKGWCLVRCPVCGKEMLEEDFGGVKVDVCVRGCKGIWFDWFELSRLDEQDEGFGNALKEALEYPRVNDENRGPINCPKCGLPMHIHRYKTAQEVNVDECYSCGGIFLDSGELRDIRGHFMSEEEQKEYFQKLIEDIPEYAAAKLDLERRKARADALLKYTRFLRLSYYTTGR